MKVLHKRSTSNNLPTGETLKQGEIAVNYSNADPFLSIRKEDGSYVRISSDEKWNESVANVDKKLADYLPKSGGTMTGSIVIGAATSFGVASDGNFYLGHPSYPVKIRGSVVAVNNHTVLHSGNIGNYKAGSASTADDSSNLGGIAASDYALKKDYLSTSGGKLTGDVQCSEGVDIMSHLSTSWAAIAFNADHIGFGVVTSPTKIRGSQLVYHNGSNEYPIIHSGNIGDYKAGSATKLVNANGYTYATSYNGDKIAVFGDGTAQNGYKTYLDGTSITLRYGAACATGFILNSSGNVTIGDSDLAGTSEYFNVKNLIGAYSSRSNGPVSKLNIHEYTTTAGANGIRLFVSSNTTNYVNTRPLILQNDYGNVLIGTSTDNGTKLYVSGDTRFDGETKINGSMRFYGKTNLSADMYINNQSVGGLNFTWSDGVSKFFIGDKVGIGTTNPVTKLQIDGEGEILRLSNPNNNAVGINFYRGGNTAWSIVNETGCLYFRDKYSNTDRVIMYEESQGGHVAFAGSINTAGGITTAGGSTINGLLDVKNTTGGIRFTQTQNNNVGVLYYSGESNWRVTDNGWSASYAIIHEGNSAHTHSYLPLNGGTIESSDWGGQLTLKRKVSSGDVILTFANNEGALGYIGFNQKDTPFFMSVAGGVNNLIHSGNIGSQTVTQAWRIGNKSQGGDVNTCLSGGGAAFNYGSNEQWVNTPTGLLYGSVIQLNSRASDSLSAQFAWDVVHNSTANTTDALWFRAADTNGYTNSKWKQVAFIGDHSHPENYDANAIRTKNTVLAAPNGSDGKATFRALVAADLPSHSHSDYLPKSGGIMTGAIVIGTATSLGVASDGNFYLGHPSYPVKIRGTSVVINDNTVLHTGNSAHTHDYIPITTSFEASNGGGSAKLTLTSISSTVDYLSMYVASNTGTNTKVRPLIIQNGYGNVGIGNIVAPAEKLEVEGTVKATTFKKTDGTEVSYVGHGHDLSTMINGLEEGTSNATANDYIVAQYAGGGTTTTSYYRRKLSAVFGALSKSNVTNALGYTPMSTAGGTFTGGVTGTSFSAATFSATTAFYQTSDETLKDFYDEIDVDFEKLKKIPKKYYKWKSNPNGALEIGTSAQKVQELYPELVGKGEKLSVDYSKLSVIALKAIDVLNDKFEAENNRLKDENQALRKENESLRNEIELIKKHLGL